MNMRTFASCFLLLQAHAARPRACLIIIVLLLLLLLLMSCPVLNKQQPIILIAVFCVSLNKQQNIQHSQMQRSTG
jgi:hypothetical protein